jgi:hypothetical protein
MENIAIVKSKKPKKNLNQILNLEFDSEDEEPSKIHAAMQPRQLESKKKRKNK